ncbi:hypothetical protein CYMTET_50265 [Cymbomonas tetramitiformis]|uniref:Uncharacterized protein n=1 Tax=Cymbomonas tetramitiformis TaxID=36881 RepID=A0AAE0BPP7_9CHLO|nr:hypothetical protein CYMTET_50265 [Cymbomonas tetramitiformis]
MINKMVMESGGMDCAKSDILADKELSTGVRNLNEASAARRQHACVVQYSESTQELQLHVGSASDISQHKRSNRERRVAQSAAGKVCTRLGFPSQDYKDYKDLIRRERNAADLVQHAPELTLVERPQVAEGPDGTAWERRRQVALGAARDGGADRWGLDLDEDLQCAGMGDG